MTPRKILMLIVTIVAFALYMMAMDPFNNNALINDLAYGQTLLFTLKVFLLVMLLILLNNIIIDVITDDEYKIDDRILVKTASKDPVGASNIVLARALRYVASSIIVLGVLIYCSKA